MTALPHLSAWRAQTKWRLLGAVLLCAVGAWAGASERSDTRDQDRALRAVQSGEALPLESVLQRLALTHPGQVLAVELEREDGRWVYEIKLLQRGGRLLKLEVDARTGAVMSRRGRDSSD